MYDLRQFKPVFFTVLLVGLAGFAYSAESPLLWFFGTIAVGVNALLVRRGWFRPLPRWLANAGTVLALLYTVMVLYEADGPPLMPIGEFLVFMQLIKLFEQRTNRDFAQVLVLSLLLMVAATINSTDLVFALILIVYLVLALYGCLLFHLKTENDRAREAHPVPEGKVNPATLRQDQRFLSASMRRFTGLVAVVSLSCAVLVFLFFPRGTGAGMLGPMQPSASSAFTGFSESMGHDRVGKIQQSNEIVAHVYAWRGDSPADAGVLLLRGVTHDTYNDPVRLAGGEEKWQWSRSFTEGIVQQIAESTRHGPLRPVEDEDALIHVRVQLQPTRSGSILSPAGPVWFSSPRETIIRYSAGDETLNDAQRGNRGVNWQYDVWATGTPSRESLTARVMRQLLAQPPRSDPQVLSRIEQFTRRPEIVGPEGMTRPKLPPYDPDNRKIAESICAYLQSKYSYTLNVPEADGEPLHSFLTQSRRGHCQLFAGAMTVMCQSLGIPARVVVGFKSDEYNAMGGYYIVRAAHAHAWVEVLTEEGWIGFDPTAAGGADSASAGGVWQKVRHFIDFLNFKWGEKVVAYDQKARDKLVDVIGLRGNRAMIWWRSLLDSVRDWFGSTSFWRASTGLIGSIMLLMILGLFVAIAFYLYQARRLRQAAARMGLGDLPSDQLYRLVRQLSFYDQLMQTLARHRIVRPKYLTHREFGETLSYLPAAAFRGILRLTEILYRVRFGQVQLSPARQRKLEGAVADVSAVLAARPVGVSGKNRGG